MKSLKIILTGASGMVGRSVLNQCLKNQAVKEVLCLNRQSLTIQNPKYSEIIVKDFFNLSEYKNQLKNSDACFYCLGISSSYVSKEEYSRITYDMTLYLAELLSKINPNIHFSYVSGVGTSEKENSRMYWANVKGKLENALLEMPELDAYMIRLGMLYPTKGIRSKTKSFDTMYRFMRPILFLMKLITPNQIVTSENFGKALILLALQGSNKKRITNKDLNTLAKTL
jgi:nucleoside-diphosphate-sugar epimerase